MAAGGVDVRVENQIVRFVSNQAIDQELVVAQIGGQRSGDVVIKALDKPRATLVIDSEGRIVVHGTHRVDAARAAAKELLLRLGLDDSGLQTELGPVIASFNPITAQISPALASDISSLLVECICSIRPILSFFPLIGR